MEELIKFIDENQPIPFSAAKTRPALVREVQDKLTALGLLDPLVQGSAETPFAPAPSHTEGPTKETLGALENFGRMTGIPMAGSVPIEFAKKLLAATPDNFLPLRTAETPQDSPETRLAKRIVRFLQGKGYWVARSPLMYNVVYIEGVNADGTLNDDADDKWNDRRIVLRIDEQGVPQIVLNVDASTEPAISFAVTAEAKKRGGVARIDFGQYKAWIMGFHNTKKYGYTHPCLKQSGKVRVFRDLNADGSRVGDRAILGAFGINQHSTKPGVLFDRVGRWSEGCLVGRHWAEHEAFLRLMQQDIRYVQDKNYQFMSAVLNGEEFSKAMMV